MGFVDPCRHEPLAEPECYGGINGRMKEGEILWHQSLGRGEEPGSGSNLLLRHKAAVSHQCVDYDRGIVIYIISYFYVSVVQR